MAQRRPLIAGNWKMNEPKGGPDGYAQALEVGFREISSQIDLLVFPPFTLIPTFSERFAEAGIMVGAQDLHWESSGAYTGEVSAPMLKAVGCTWVLVGHSERRTYFAESGDILAWKLRAALRAGLAPVYCLGERLEHREAGRTQAVVSAQFWEVLGGLEREEMLRTVIAYEPVWAIGTGKTATPEQAQEVHALIRRMLGEAFGSDVAAQVRILYGGSVKPENAASLLEQPDIDGALVGGASLDPQSFLAIAGSA